MTPSITSRMLEAEIVRLNENLGRPPHKTDPVTGLCTPGHLWLFRCGRWWTLKETVNAQGDCRDYWGADFTRTGILRRLIAFNDGIVVGVLHALNTARQEQEVVF